MSLVTNENKYKQGNILSYLEGYHIKVKTFILHYCLQLLCCLLSLCRCYHGLFLHSHSRVIYYLHFDTDISIVTSCCHDCCCMESCHTLHLLNLWVFMIPGSSTQCDLLSSRMTVLSTMKFVLLHPDLLHSWFALCQWREEMTCLECSWHFWLQ